MNINLKQTYTCSRTLRTASLDVMTTLTIQRDENNKSQKKTKIISYYCILIDPIQMKTF